MIETIKGYENLYSITKGGEIYSHRFGKYLVGDVNNGGYRRVILCKDKKRKRFFIHRLVAEHFIPNPDNKRTVNHKDGNKLNNCVENLEWATDSEQHLHSWNMGLEKVTKNFIQEVNRKIPKEEIDNLVELYKKGELKVVEQAKRFKVTKGAIYMTIYKRLKNEKQRSFRSK